MPSSSAIRAGRAYVELFGDDSKLVRVLDGAEKRIEGMGKGIMSFGGKLMAGGAALAAPLVGAVKSFTDWGSELTHMSERTGVGVESLSELGYAAKMTGADSETLEAGLRKMQKAITGADEESKAAQQSLDRLGLAAADLQGLSPEKQFELIGKRIAGIEDPTVRAGIALELFGRSGTMLLPMLGDLSSLRAEARRLGQTISTEDAEAADTFGSAVDSLWGSIRGGAAAIGGALAPALTDVTTRTTEFVASAARWIGNNKELVLTFGKIAAGVVAAGAAIVAIGAVIYGVGMALGVLSSIASGVGTVVTGLGAAFGVIGSVLGAILSPLGLIVGGLAALAGYFLSTGQAGEYVGGILNWMGEMFGYLKDIALTSWSAITNAIASGDIGAAMNVAWTLMKMLWQEGIGWLTSKWTAFKGWFLEVWNEAVYGTAMLMTEAWAGLQRTWVTVVSFLKSIWSQFTTWAANSWNSMQQSIGGVFIDALAKVGILTKQEADWAKKDMNKSLDDKKAGRTKEAGDYQAEIDKEENQRKAGINQQENDSLNALTSEMLAKDDARQKGLDADLAASKEAAAKAKADWENSLAAAQAAGAGPGGPEKPKKPGAKPGDFSGVDITGKGKSETSGTFNPFALAGLGTGGNFAEATANHTKLSYLELRRIRQEGVPIAATS